MPWSMAKLDDTPSAPAAQQTTKMEIPVRRIAGHAFGPDGTCDNVVSSVDNPAHRCGRRFGDIASATKDDSHKTGWACTGTLMPGEPHGHRDGARTHLGGTESAHSMFIIFPIPLFLLALWIAWPRSVIGQVILTILLFVGSIAILAFIVAGMRGYLAPTGYTNDR